MPTSRPGPTWFPRSLPAALAFADEARDVGGAGRELQQEHLDRDRLLRDRGGSLVDGGHAAAPSQRSTRVFPAKTWPGVRISAFRIRGNHSIDAPHHPGFATTQRAVLKTAVFACAFGITGTGLFTPRTRSLERRARRRVQHVGGQRERQTAQTGEEAAREVLRGVHHERVRHRPPLRDGPYGHPRSGPDAPQIANRSVKCTASSARWRSRRQEAMAQAGRLRRRHRRRHPRVLQPAALVPGGRGRGSGGAPAPGLRLRHERRVLLRHLRHQHRARPRPRGQHRRGARGVAGICTGHPQLPRSREPLHLRRRVHRRHRRGSGKSKAKEAWRIIGHASGDQVLEQHPEQRRLPRPFAIPSTATTSTSCSSSAAALSSGGVADGRGPHLHASGERRRRPTDIRGCGCIRPTAR